MDIVTLIRIAIGVIFLVLMVWLFIRRVRKSGRQRSGSLSKIEAASKVKTSPAKMTPGSNAIASTAAPNASAVTPTPAAQIVTQVPIANPPTRAPAAKALANDAIAERASHVASAETPAPAASSSTKSLFISYRRQDSQHITGRIYDRMATRFGREAVFKDVDSIPLGLDFREHLRQQVGSCAVLVAVIGKDWNPLSASGQRRLSDPRDHLRIEIESALDRHIPVIPVLVDGIDMPHEGELPPSLGQLAYHNGIAVRPDPDFHHDMDRLVRGIEQLLK
jgi:hypothetical protein